MKRFILVLMVVFVLAMPGILNADMVVDSKTLGPTAPNGTSYWVIDTTKTNWDNMSVQIMGTPVHSGTSGSGTTVTVLFAGTNEKPTTAQLAGTLAFPVLDWAMAYNALNILTGATKEPRSISIPPSKYLIGKILSGITGFSATFEFTGREGLGWSNPVPICVERGSLSLNASSGISAVATPPDGTKYAIFFVEPTSGATAYLTPDSVTTRTYTAGKSIASGDAWPVKTNKAELSKFRAYSPATTTNPAYLVYEYWTDKPY